jgi:hypothetical protein
MAAVIQIFASQLMRQTVQPLTAATADLEEPISVLKSRMEAIQTRLAEDVETATPEVMNMVNRLDKLIKSATNG